MFVAIERHCMVAAIFVLMHDEQNKDGGCLATPFNVLVKENFILDDIGLIRQKHDINFAILIQL